MSRSYKKNPWVTDNVHSKERKKVANNKVRTSVKHEEEMLPQGSTYKKIHESWEIHDYAFRQTKRAALQWWYKHNTEPYVIKKYPNEKAVLREWYKYHRNK